MVGCIHGNGVLPPNSLSYSALTHSNGRVECVNGQYTRVMRRPAVAVRGPLSKLREERHVDRNSQRREPFSFSGGAGTGPFV